MVSQREKDEGCGASVRTSSAVLRVSQRGMIKAHADEERARSI